MRGGCIDGTSVRYLQLKPAGRVIKKASQGNTVEPTFSLIQPVLLQAVFPITSAIAESGFQEDGSRHSKMNFSPH
jgi:hypothetical protein